MHMMYILYLSYSYSQTKKKSPDSGPAGSCCRESGAFRHKSCSTGLACQSFDLKFLQHAQSTHAVIPCKLHAAWLWKS